MSPNTLPAQRWEQRPVVHHVLQTARDEGFDELQARLIAARVSAVPEVGIAGLMRPKTTDLPRVSSLPDIDKATAAIVDAITDGKVIAAVCDHDADGCTSAAILWCAMHERFRVPRERLQIVTSHRLKEGYGVSTKLVERIMSLSPRPDLIVTADQGSCDEPRFRQLLEEGRCRTVVTDHHALPPAGPPASAVACVNPSRVDSAYGDPSIAGCMVAWLVMVAVRHRLVAIGYLREDEGRLNDLLPYVAVGTVADCSDLGTSLANRWAVQQGIARILESDRPVWLAFSEMLSRPWSAETLAFNVAPRINAASRVGDAGRAVEALCANDMETARTWIAQLEDANRQRREIQTALTERALSEASKQVSAGVRGLAIAFYEDGHAGVHGIVASRVVEATGLPCMCLSPAEGEPGVMTGSIRSVPGVHVKELIDEISAACPALALRGGGHAGAGGVRIARELVPQLAAQWDARVSLRLEDRPPAPLYHDGPLGEGLSAGLLDKIDALQPFGRGFPEPVFCDQVEVLSAKTVGADLAHLRMEVRWPDGRKVAVIAFNDGARLREIDSRPITLIYKVARSTFARGPGYDVQAVAWWQGDQPTGGV